MRRTPLSFSLVPMPPMAAELIAEILDGEALRPRQGDDDELV
jgi:hypothetical protein